MNEEGPILLGEAPSKSGDRFHRFPLSGRPARVLCQLAGIPPVEGGTAYGKWTWALYDYFECRNLFERYAHATPWSAPAARSRAQSLLPDLPGRMLICLGTKPQAAVWQALGYDGDPPPRYEWQVIGGGEWRAPFEWTTIPHPSGLNRLYEEGEERVAAGVILRMALRRAAAIADPESVA